MKKVFAMLLFLLSTLALVHARTSTDERETRAAQNRARAIMLYVDASEAPRHILHVGMAIPVQAGATTLFYPKWIPGEHGPTGPITNLVGLKMTAGGRNVPWQRDAADMFTFHCDVPQGENMLVVDFDFVLSSDPNGFSAAASSTAQLAVISWNQLLLYPQGANPETLMYNPTLRVPENWKFGTALPVNKESTGGVNFKPVSLVTLVDSPVIAGTYFRAIPLVTGEGATEIDMVADSAAALEMSPELIGKYKRLVAETMALFGARHYENYHFLFTLSDHVASFGLEHHQSSDDRVPERTLLEESLRKINGDLLPHEFVHSWNGKYRRPADLTTPDYQQPMKSELIWVYEGLTQYLGKLLAVRSGLWTMEDYRDNLALIAATLDNQAGRAWRPLVDTTTAAQLLYEAPSEWANLRRGTDFYDEGVLIWLEADSIIRQQSKGTRSLEDFCKRFYGNSSGAPTVKTYTYDDVVRTMNEVAPYDWRTFFQERIYDVATRAPLGGITGEGWHLVYTDEPNEYMEAQEEASKGATDFSFSLGLKLEGEENKIADVSGVAATTGLSPGMKLVAVNGRRTTPDILREALRAAKTNNAPLELLIENADFFKTYRLNYAQGERYPHLIRDNSKPDLLGQLLRANGN
jgi:predicted metalloprotease with PDZ domain